MFFFAARVTYILYIFGFSTFGYLSFKMADHMHWAALLLSTFVAFFCDCVSIIIIVFINYLLQLLKIR